MTCGCQKHNVRFGAARFAYYRQSLRGGSRSRHMSKRYENVVIRQCAKCEFEKNNIKNKMNLGYKGCRAFSGQYLEMGKKNINVKPARRR